MQHGGKRTGAGRKPTDQESNHVDKYNEARASKEAALARLRQIEVETREGLLLEVADVQEQVSTSFKRIAQAVFSLPDNLERKAALSAEQSEICANEIDVVMDGLREDLQSLMNPETTSGETS